MLSLIVTIQGAGPPWPITTFNFLVDALNPGAVFTLQIFNYSAGVVAFCWHLSSGGGI